MTALDIALVLLADVLAVEWLGARLGQLRADRARERALDLGLRVAEQGRRATRLAAALQVWR